MAEAVMLSAREKLEKLLVEKAKFLEGAEEQVRGLIDDLKWNAFFVDRREEEGLNHHYIKSVAEIAHDAHVSIDTLISTVADSTSISHLNNLTEEIQSIRSRIEAVQTDIKNYNQSLKEGGVDFTRSHTVELPRVQEEDTVGLFEEVILVFNRAILYPSQTLSILYILGMGGVGKTVLASLLYNYRYMGEWYPTRAWVHVSDDFSVEKVFIELIKQLGMEGEPENLDSLSVDDLRERVFRRLKGRKYFIVLDSVWSLDMDMVLSAFHSEDFYSRLVITSRSRSITRTGFIKSPLESTSGTGFITDPSRSFFTKEFVQYIHEKKFLDDSNSWNLFVKKVFTSDHRCPKHLEKIGRQIVRKCNGLPLAILEAGRKLAGKEESESVWQEFLKSMDLIETSASLEISFNRLSARLKSCFSQLSFFKEDTTVRVDKLLHIWIAGGMLPHPNKEDLTEEHIARQDLEELIGEHMVQVKDRSRDNQVKNCDINYILYKLAIKEAKNELMFEVMTDEGPDHQSSHKPRHRAICCSRDKFNYSTNQDKHLVSLFFRGGGSFDSSPSYWESFGLVKILDFEGFGLKSLPEMVGTLITLKYLGLRNNYLQELPRSLGQLKKLKVLDMALNFLIEVPNIIWEMDSLRHLYMSDIIYGEPLKINQLCNLQTLTYISVDNWMHQVSSLKMMTSLCKLGIEEVDENSDASKLFTSLAELKKLEHLILRGFRFKSMPELQGLEALRGLKQLKPDGLLTRLPNKFPPNIEYLSLSNSCLDEDPMPILGKLPKLLYLKLRNAFIGEKMEIPALGFEKLQILCLEELWHLRIIEVWLSITPVMQLEIKSCPHLMTLPQGIGWMKNLKKLTMVTTKDIAATIRELSFISKLEQVDIQP